MPSSSRSLVEISFTNANQVQAKAKAKTKPRADSKIRQLILRYIQVKERKIATMTKRLPF